MASSPPQITTEEGWKQGNFFEHIIKNDHQDLKTLIKIREETASVVKEKFTRADFCNDLCMIKLHEYDDARMENFKPTSHIPRITDTKEEVVKQFLFEMQKIKLIFAVHAENSYFLREQECKIKRLRQVFHKIINNSKLSAQIKKQDEGLYAFLLKQTLAADYKNENFLWDRTENFLMGREIVDAGVGPNEDHDIMLGFQSVYDEDLLEFYEGGPGPLAYPMELQDIINKQHAAQQAVIDAHPDFVPL